MKKIVLSISLCFVLFCLSFILIGCGNASTNIEDNISDIRYGVYDASNEQASATFIYGEREENYKVDGISNQRVDFGIISVNFKSKPSANEIDFILKYDNSEITGKLEKSPFSSEYLADIGKQIDSNINLELTIEIDGEEIKFNLEKKNLEINANQALKIGSKALNDEINKLKSQGSCEYYLKIISDNKSNFGTYFWAFTVVSETGTKHNVVFSTNSENILVKN